MYTGREWIMQIGVYDYRNRWYQPKLGRFLQADPIGFAAGDANLFRYCGGDPINRRDPYGLADEPNHPRVAKQNEGVQSGTVTISEVRVSATYRDPVEVYNDAFADVNTGAGPNDQDSASGNDAGSGAGNGILLAKNQLPHHHRPPNIRRPRVDKPEEPKDSHKKVPVPQFNFQPHAPEDPVEKQARNPQGGAGSLVAAYVLLRDLYLGFLDLIPPYKAPYMPYAPLPSVPAPYPAPIPTGPPAPRGG